MDWFYLDDQRQRTGPFDDGEIPVMIADGRLKPDTLVWNETMKDWMRASDAEISSQFHTKSQPAVPPIPPPPPGYSPAEKNPANPSSGGCRLRTVGIILAGTALILLLIALITAKACSNSSSAHNTREEPNYYLGAVEMTKKICPTCFGNAKLQMTCQPCGGAGTIRTPSGYVTTCPQCQGTARVVTPCPDCGGTGKRR